MDFDIDSSAGLMPKIQALIAPPESDDTSKANKKKEGLELHPYYKRPGKGHNRDCCDACSEGGNLICCDKCPASFHLACHDPPLEDEDIPLGQWLCHKCRMAGGLPPLKDILKAKMESSSTETSDAPGKDESITEAPTRAGRSRTSSSASLESNKSRGRGRVSAAAACAAAQPVTTTSTAVGPDKHSALETLIAAASSMNPIQFDLPREMVLPINFPGTDRAPTRGRKASASKRSRTLELDNGLVPLPAKTCFECRKSCKRAPLLACDYCPLLFHLDCLDPPLTSLPCGRWMCPNHVEQAIDEKLLTSLSVTQRVALWDKYTGPIDQDAVKTEFLQKTRRQNPPFRFKVKLAPRNRAKVPNAVKEMYKNRPPLIPSLRDVLRDSDFAVHWTDSVSNSFEFKSEENTENQEIRESGPTETEQEEWLSSIVALQTSIACHLSSKKRKLSETNDLLENEIKSEVENDGECYDTKIKKTIQFKSFRAETIKSDANVDSHVNGLLDKHIPSSLDNNDSSECNSADGFNGTFSRSSLEPFKIQNGDTYSLSELSPELSQASEKLGGKMSHNYQREEDLRELQRLSSSKAQLEGLSNLLEKSLDCHVPDNHINKIDERLIRLLALQRLQQLTPSSRPSSYSSLTLKTQPSAMPRRRVFWPTQESGLKPRALLTPLNGSQPPMPIYYRVMEIGTGGDMDICLTYYGHCNYVTAKHAVIICDEVNRHYELMNYSEHGTTVDNVLYSCDFSEKTLPKEQPLSPSSNAQHHGRRSTGSNSGAGSLGANHVETSEAEVEVPPLIQKIRAVVDKRRGVVREEDNIPEPSKMPADIGKVDRRCSCRASSSSLIGGSGAGWEGTALLNHGSFIKFGCIQFTFSVLNFVSPPLKEMCQDGSGMAAATDGKGPIPHRILKRERDSTSSSTLTISPSPPPDKVGGGLPRSVRKSKEHEKHEENEDDEEEEEDDDEEEEEDKEESNDNESDPDDNEENDENMEEVAEAVMSDDLEMHESLSLVKQGQESNSVGSLDASNS